MKKTLTVILLTAIATNLIWFAVVGCMFYFGSGWTTTTSTPINESMTNNFVLMVMRDLTTQSFAFSFRETGNTPTNFLATNRIFLTRPLHAGQEFTIAVQDARDTEPRR